MAALKIVFPVNVHFIDSIFVVQFISKCIHSKVAAFGIVGFIIAKHSRTEWANSFDLCGRILHVFSSYSVFDGISKCVRLSFAYGTKREREKESGLHGYQFRFVFVPFGVRKALNGMR